MTFATRIFPAEGEEDDLWNQWVHGAVGGCERRVLLRVPQEDALASDHLLRVPGAAVVQLDRIGAAWAAAQLAADASLLGMGLGARVVLVPEGGRWYADLVVIRTRGRVRFGCGSQDVLRALAATRRVCLQSLGSDRVAPGGSSRR
jgi:hypothetical protein